jgi:hypothetical protein
MSAPTPLTGTAVSSTEAPGPPGYAVIPHKEKEQAVPPLAPTAVTSSEVTPAGTVNEYVPAPVYVHVVVGPEVVHGEAAWAAGPVAISAPAADPSMSPAAPVTTAKRRIRPYTTR